ncbi:MAG TPA: hypothetical protein VEZ90_18855 [Blastocatellia bacterium]|nr:hypothetical protein [Blastocatellia bacterium]
MRIGLSTSLALALLVPALPFSGTLPQNRPTSNETSSKQGVDNGDKGWPRKIASGGTTIVIYQPQLEKWEGDQIQAYAAVAVETSTSQQPTYGVVYFTARTEVDKVNRLVTLDDFKLLRGSFPSAADQTSEYLKILQEAGNTTVDTIALDRLEAELATEQAEKNGAGYKLKNNPPKIIFSTRPAVLVSIDGPPVLRPLAEDSLQRVINTRALMVFDQKKSTYYLYLMDGWVESLTPEGPWSYAKHLPHNLNSVKDKLAASNQVDLLSGEENTGADNGDLENGDSGEGVDGSEPLKKRVSDGTFPTIYVSAVPTELLIAQGEPQFKPVTGTGLLYVTNTGDHIFLNTANQDYYVLLSGRWFKAKSLEGPWQFVAGNELPEDFAKIPEGHPQASVLASTPGTAAAKEALISNDIPQTATITRTEAELTVTYDGEPQFKPIEGTGLQYAVNSRTPVVQVASGSYLAVENGVWFTAEAPDGPWSVATSVPPAIYGIPPTSPVHYVSYVKVYDSTPEVVYTGYTPGYYGTVVDDDGLVVYGTGWYYPPYIGSYWIGWPYTYGCGAGFGWTPWGGWSLDFGIGFWYPFWRPWWGPLGWGWGWPGWRPRWGWGHWGGVAGLNVYGRWGHSAWVRTRASWADAHGDVHRDADGRMHNPRTGAAGEKALGAGASRSERGKRGTDKTGAGAGRSDSNIYAGRDGNVYRYDQNGGWKQHNKGRWQVPNGSFDQRSMDRARQSRAIGGQRWGTYNSSGFGGHGPGGFPGARGGGGRRR